MGMGQAGKKASLAAELAGKGPKENSKDTQTQNTEILKVVRKGLEIDSILNTRLRKFCFEQNLKESVVFRRALDEFLNKRGY